MKRERERNKEREREREREKTEKKYRIWIIDNNRQISPMLAFNLKFYFFKVGP